MTCHLSQIPAHALMLLDLVAYAFFFFFLFVSLGSVWSGRAAHCRWCQPDPIHGFLTRPNLARAFNGSVSAEGLTNKYLSTLRSARCIQ